MAEPREIDEFLLAIERRVQQQNEDLGAIVSAIEALPHDARLTMPTPEASPLLLPERSCGSPPHSLFIRG